MADDRLTLHRVAWKEILPWLMIARCFRLAVSLPIMFVATIGLFLMPVGEAIARRVFVDDSPVVAAPQTANMAAPGIPVEVARTPAGWTYLTPLWNVPGEDVRGVYWSFVRPAWNLFDRRLSLADFCYYLFVLLWNVAIWAFLGAAITRMAVVYLGRDERVTLRDAVRHSVRKYGWNFSAPLFPLLGIAFLVIPLLLLGLIMRFDVGVLIAALVWPLAIIAGFAMAVLLVGLLFGWPLMWPTISAEEESDAFEAFSRSYSYTFQRPLHYLFYAAIAVLLGILGWILVGNFAEAVVALTHWGVSFGAGRERTMEVVTATDEASRSLLTGMTLIAWWDWVVRMIARAFNYSFFFCAVSAIYLLLRRQVDQTDFDEVYVPDDVTRYGLPPLRTGPEGIPEVSQTNPPT